MNQVYELTKFPQVEAEHRGALVRVSCPKCEKRQGLSPQQFTARCPSCGMIFEVKR